jgi:hypothetical protein
MGIIGSGHRILATQKMGAIWAPDSSFQKGVFLCPLVFLVLLSESRFLGNGAVSEFRALI